MGPVIDQAAFNKIMNYIEIGKEEGELMIGGEGDDSKGYFIKPTIFADLDPKARIMQEEIFGPVVAFAKAKDFDEAIEIANNTDYGLTGAVITNNREHIEQAVKISMLETFTSTVAVLVLLLAINHLVDSICQVLTLKQADQITYYFICKQKQHQKCFKHYYTMEPSTGGSIGYKEEFYLMFYYEDIPAKKDEEEDYKCQEISIYY